MTSEIERSLGLLREIQDNLDDCFNRVIETLETREDFMNSISIILGMMEIGKFHILQEMLIVGQELEEPMNGDFE